MVKFAISAAVLLGALPVFALFVSVNANTAHGRVTVLNGIPYYVGDIAVARIPEVAVFSPNQMPDIDVMPITVISSNSSSFTSTEFDGVIADYLARDDVFSTSFLSGENEPYLIITSKIRNILTEAAIYLSYTGNGAPVIEDQSIAAVVEKHATPLFFVSPSYAANVSQSVNKAYLMEKIPSGPYFVSTKSGQVFEAHRLYEDTHYTFLEPAVGDGLGGYRALSANSEVGHVPQSPFAHWLTSIQGILGPSIAVPSRLYYTVTPEKPLAGVCRPFPPVPILT
jgi:hypothetical protein